MWPLSPPREIRGEEGFEVTEVEMTGEVAAFAATSEKVTAKYVQGSGWGAEKFFFHAFCFCVRSIFKTRK